MAQRKKMERRLKPYVADKDKGWPKFRAEKTDHVPGNAKGISKYDKLIAKNANRSRKKGARQESKKIIANGRLGELAESDSQET